MSEVSCKVIEDLLPLYHDGVCSDESKKMVEEHLAGCNNCKSQLNRIKSDIILPNETIAKNYQDGKMIRDMADFWNYTKTKAFLKGLIGAAALFTVVFLGYLGLFTWNIISVPTDVVEISDVCKLTDGKIAYHVELTDGYQLNECRFNMDEDGNFYVTPLRPIIKKKITGLAGLANMYDSLNDVQKSAYQDKYGAGKDIKALYYGTPKDHILIWKNGMDLPAASDKVEAVFSGEN